MFNVTVIKIKDIIKYIASLIILILLVLGLARFFGDSKENKLGTNLENTIYTISQKNFIECLNKTIPGVEEVNKAENESASNENEAKSENILNALLQVELTKIEEQETLNDEQNQEQENNQEEMAVANSETEVVTQNPITVNPTNSYGAVQIKNETGYALTEEMLTPDIEVNNSNIVIYHTHTCESYTPTEQNQYEATGSYRTTDQAHSVVNVGDVLTNYLTEYGYNVNHDKTFHDYPAYTGSYTRSLSTIESILQTTSADVVIDLHRDAVGSNSNYAPTVRIGEDYCAQLMFVIGTNGGGLWHPNWNQNLKFAVKIQQKAEELYPGLFKPIILRNSRYNQHVSKAATIIEVGATGNTLEQCQTSMKYLSKIMSEVMK